MSGGVYRRLQLGYKLGELRDNSIRGYIRQKNTSLNTNLKILSLFFSLLGESEKPLFLSSWQHCATCYPTFAFPARTFASGPSLASSASTSSVALSSQPAAASSTSRQSRLISKDFYHDLHSLCTIMATLCRNPSSTVFGRNSLAASSARNLSATHILLAKYRRGNGDKPRGRRRAPSRDGTQR